MTVGVHINRTLIGGRARANIHVQPWIAFRPEWLLVPKEIAIHFLITSVKVGNSNQLTSTSVLPATMFVDKTEEVRLKMEICQVVRFVTVSVTNVEAYPSVFEAHVHGEHVL